ncbi:hypothetical protein KK062_22555 [Fulvivirgaceae bacterium PWU5]|uniref:Uncharacterized protein n=1 Tax=Dawidia cretensis TaxID=2782350 RepID=A0AAP2GRT6_9BACT|nr:hypothetical protein [Dawidia cretensis]MBT1711041.1 hypothetical protein [Dawidia cretensis]
MLETQGWIEYSPYFTQEERDEEHSWLTWMCVNSIIDHVDKVTETLFGYSKRILRKEFEIESLAKDRGIPINASYIVKMEMEKIEAFEQKYGTGEIFGYSVIYYDEIRKAALSIPADSLWKKLFALVELFKALKGLEDNQIRLVVWFEW